MAIIAALLQILGPLLASWLESCTKKTFKDAAKGLPAADTYASEGEAAAALLDAAIANLPKRARLRRRALQALKAKAVVGGKIRTKPLSEAEVAEGKKLLKGIRP